MKKCIWVFLLSFLILGGSETLQASVDGTARDTGEKARTSRARHKKSASKTGPIDSLAADVYADRIVARLWSGSVVSKDDMSRLLDNLRDGEPVTDKATEKAQLSRFIKDWGVIIEATSIGRGEEKSKQENIEAFVNILNEFAETESKAKMVSALSMIQTRYGD